MSYQPADAATMLRVDTAVAAIDHQTASIVADRQWWSTFLAPAPTCRHGVTAPCGICPEGK